jgi:DNA-binding response OmpR family regulator
VVAPVWFPDVIILDLAMPGLDGFQTILRLKVEARTTRIPVLVLTGAATDQGARRAMRMGAIRVLFKPCAAEALRAALDAIITSPPSAPDQQSG